MAARRGAYHVLLLASMFAIPGACAHGAGFGNGQATLVFDAGGVRPPPLPWPGIKLSSPVAADAIRRALDEASRRLIDPACEQLLTEFRDTAGRLLSERLAALGTAVWEYLGWIQFHDGSSSLCGNGWTLLYTVPGSRIVNVCKVAVEAAGVEGRDHLAASIIHEMLHTLGLPENPPSSAEITARVKRACWAKGR